MASVEVIVEDLRNNYTLSELGVLAEFHDIPVTTGASETIMAIATAVFTAAGHTVKN